MPDLAGPLQVVLERQDADAPRRVMLNDQENAVERGAEEDALAWRRRGRPQMTGPS